MTAVALVLSIVSLLASGAAAWYTRHNALTERAKLHKEHQPAFRAAFDSRSDPRGGHEDDRHDVVAFVYVTGPGTLDQVSVTLVHRSEAVHPPVMSIGSGLDAPTGTVAELSTPLALGQERMVRVDRHPDAHGGIVPFRLHCASGRDEWDVVVECRVPGMPMAIYR